MNSQHTNTELKLREEIFRLQDIIMAMQTTLGLQVGNDRLAGYHLMGVAEDGASGWHNPETDHWLERDPKGVVFDPKDIHTIDSDRTLHSFNEKWRGE